MSTCRVGCLQKGKPKNLVYIHISFSPLSNESMFCVTPYKMILAFGVLLTVLLVAMLFALYSCVKARVLKARLQPPHHPPEAARHSPVTSPYYRFAH